MEAFDNDFRKSADYRTWTAAIRAEHPRLPDYLVDCAIMCHMSDRQAYKSHKHTPAPTRKPFSTHVLEGAVSISSPKEKTDDDILHHIPESC